MVHTNGNSNLRLKIGLAEMLSGADVSNKVEGAGQHNPHRSEDPWVERVIRLHGGA
jgi:hypothetical protein